MARSHPPLSLKTAPPGHPFAELACLLPRVAPSARVAVAFSAGLDSTALLSCAALAYGPARVLAIHINHGLQEAAGDFEAKAASRCAALGCELSTLLVDASAARGQSPEEAARDARYEALARAALDAGAECCLLAHHANDQAETLILALSRGLGVQGLSGMGESFSRHGCLFVRPWLSQPRARIEQAMARASLDWAEDPTNQDERFSRNLARKKAMPGLLEAFPGFLSAAARSMAHCASAQAVLDEVAAEDLARIQTPEKDLLLKPLRALSEPRRAHVVRHWLLASHGQYPTQAQTDEACAQAMASASGGAIDIKCGKGRLARRKDVLTFLDVPAHKPSPRGPGA